MTLDKEGAHGMIFSEEWPRVKKIQRDKFDKVAT